jgi:23S rRNA (cytidine1920-2'-O)/16S rRNA (cytidine1409-2'-O)-methyltransferase
MSSKMQRLDLLLVARGLAESREKAQALCLAGEVWSGEKRLEKPGVKVADDIPLEVRSRTAAFASRAGHKLAHALQSFGLDPSGRVALDIGASTGGFTDCLLKAGATHVFAVDVGYGQLEAKLRADERVTNIERTNARYLKLADLEAKSPSARAIDLVVVDVSFISLRKVLENLAAELPFARHWLLLFKPQFEVGREHVGKGGLVKDDAVVQEALSQFDEWTRLLKWTRRGGPESSPLTGKKSGNLEYLILYEQPQA